MDPCRDRAICRERLSPAASDRYFFPSFGRSGGLLPATATASVQSSPFDQSALTDTAARLIEAARCAGADAAGAVAVRSLALSLRERACAVEVADRSADDSF